MADGWYAEIAIPFKSLKFRGEDPQTWGINFLRHNRRKNELDYWSPIPRAYALTRVSLAGELRGLRNLALGWDLKLKPFVVSGTAWTMISALVSATQCSLSGAANERQSDALAYTLTKPA